MDNQYLVPQCFLPHQPHMATQINPVFIFCNSNLKCSVVSILKCHFSDLRSIGGQIIFSAKPMITVPFTKIDAMKIKDISHTDGVQQVASRA